MAENIVTFRCDDELLEAIDEAVENSAVNSRAEYLRLFLAANHGASGPNQAESVANQTASGSNQSESLANHSASIPNHNASAANRFEQIEQRLDELEAAVFDDDRDDVQVDRDDEQGERVDEQPRPTGEEVTLEYREGDLEPVIEAWEPGRGPQERQEQREIGAAALRWLRDRGEPAKRGDFVGALYQDTRKDGQKEDAWWLRTVREALEVDHSPRPSPTRARRLDPAAG